MVIKLGMKAVVYKAVTDTFEDKSGKKIPFYKLAIEQGADITSISCTEEVAQKIEPMKEHNLLCDFNTESKKLRITGVASVK